MKDLFMELSAAISGMQSAKIAGQVNMAVAKKVLDTQKQAGAGVLAMLDAATRGPAQAGDALVAAATGLGGIIDTFA
jgi:hypothetical protein